MTRRRCWLALAFCLIVVGAATAQQPPRQRPRVPPPQPEWVFYLQTESVRDDLRLDNKQTEQLGRLGNVWAEAVKDHAQWKDDERSARMNDATAALNRERDKILTADQVKRLGQIELQVYRHRTSTAALYSHPRTVAALKVTDEQASRMEMLLAKRRGDIEPLFLSGKKYDDIAADVDAYREKTEAMLEGVLTEEQKKGLAELLGRPFKGTLSARGGFSAPVSVSALELNFMASPELARELGLSADQTKILSELGVKYRADVTETLRAGGDTDAVQKKYAKQLDEAVPADRRKRLREVVLQQVVDPESPYSQRRLLEVEAELKVTDEQKKKLEAGDSLEKVLDAGQKKAWQAMLGKKYEGRLTPGLFGTPRPPSLGLRSAYLLFRPVQDELKLTDAQKKEHEAVLTAWQDAAKDHRDWDANERDKKVAELRKEFEPKLDKLLEAGQAKRLDQIMLQRGLVELTRANRGDRATPRSS